MVTQAKAKILFSGEYFVLKGAPALGASLPYQLNVYNPPEVSLSGPEDSTLEKEKKLFWNHIREKYPHLPLDFYFSVDSQIPIASGLGSSAALCVALSKQMVQKGWIDSSEEMEWAWHAENFFHHYSSGVDVALSGQDKMGLYYREQFPSIHPVELPSFYILAGCLKKQTMTKESVKNFLQKDKNSLLKEQLWQKWNEQMVPILEKKSYDWEEFSSIIEISHQYLLQLGLCSDEFLKLKGYIQHHIPCVGKMSGSGQGGLFFFVFPHKNDLNTTQQLLQFYIREYLHQQSLIYRWEYHCQKQEIICV